jgi:hypothetical protein
MIEEMDSAMKKIEADIEQQAQNLIDKGGDQVSASIDTHQKETKQVKQGTMSR